jgi:hypothetical protein
MTIVQASIKKKPEGTLGTFGLDERLSASIELDQTWPVDCITKPW